MGTPILHPKVADIILEDKRESQGRSSKVEPFRSFLRDKSYLCVAAVAVKVTKY